MQTKRLFIGTFVNKSLFRNIYSEIQDDFAVASYGKWVELNNLHFTIKFLGDVDNSEIPELKRVLKDWLKIYNSELFIKGLGVLPNLKNPRVLYASFTNPDGTIIKAHSEIEKILSGLGFEPENRALKLHITLQRPKSSSQDEFRKLLDKYKEFDFGVMNEFEISLIESRLSPLGPTYNII
jgi:RNA 2',3'-cyclic 3'-phosphodiesterase